MLFLSTLILFALDQASKYWVQTVLAQMGTMPVIPALFRFRYAQNTGAAFSMLTGNNVFLMAFSALLILGVFVLYIKFARRSSVLLRLSALLIAFGGLGNLIDRFLYGYVVDFIELTFMRFAVFNVADAMINVGALLFVISVLLPGKGAKKRAVDG